MSWRKKIGWRGPLSDPVSVRTGAVIESAAGLACCAWGGGPPQGEQGREPSGADAAEDESQRTHYRSTAERESPLQSLVKSSRARRPTRRARPEGAPKYIRRFRLHNPPQRSCTSPFRPTYSGIVASYSPSSALRRRGGGPGAGAPGAASAARPATPPCGRPAGESASTARRSSSGSQHHLSGPVRWPSSMARTHVGGDAARRGRSRSSSASLMVKVTDTPSPTTWTQHSFRLPDPVLPGPAPARAHVAHRFGDAVERARARRAAP